MLPWTCLVWNLISDIPSMPSLEDSHAIHIRPISMKFTKIRSTIPSLHMSKIISIQKDYHMNFHIEQKRPLLLARGVSVHIFWNHFQIENLAISELNIWSYCIVNYLIGPGKFEWYFRYLIFQIISVIRGWGISCEIALRWMSLDLTDDKSTLVQVMAYCRQATSHYLIQCWPRYLSPYGVTRPQWLNNFDFSSKINPSCLCDWFIRTFDMIFLSKAKDEK